MAIDIFLVTGTVVLFACVVVLLLLRIAELLWGDE